jgi:hypothetical protein
MQALEMDYDLSFFDTDPFEPMPGGTMSIHPFEIGHFIELPYTLVQDYSLFDILHERSPNIWMEKVNFIARYHGLALLNVHPDYMLDSSKLNVYRDFLKRMKDLGGFWHALPQEAAAWWRLRAGLEFGPRPEGAHEGKIILEDGDIRCVF